MADGSDSAGRRPRTFAEKLTRLVNVMHKPGEPVMSDRAVAARVRNNGGAISQGYFAELRTGRKTNPGLDHITAIAAAFGVSAGYFTDPDVAEKVDRELDRLEQEHQKDRLRELAARTASLSADDRDALMRLVDEKLVELNQKTSGDPGAQG